MKIDDDTIRQLRVFSVEQHPITTDKDQSKEGVSVYSVLEHAKTIQGRAMLCSWLRCPTMSLSVIRERQDSLSFIIEENEKSDVMGKIRNCIKDIVSLGTVVPRFQQLLQSDSDWCCLHRAFCLYSVTKR